MHRRASSSVLLSKKKRWRIASRAGSALTEKSFAFPRRKPGREGFNVTLPNKKPLHIVEDFGAALTEKSFEFPRRKPRREGFNVTAPKKKRAGIVSVGAASKLTPPAATASSRCP